MEPRRLLPWERRATPVAGEYTVPAYLAALERA